MNYRNNNSMSFYQASPSGGGSGSGGGDGGGGDHHAHHHNHHQQLNGYQQQPQQQQPQQQQTTASYSSGHGAQVALEMMPTNSGPGGGGVSNHHPHHHPQHPHHPHPHHQQRAMSLDQGASAYMSPAQQHQLVTPNGRLMQQQQQQQQHNHSMAAHAVHGDSHAELSMSSPLSASLPSTSGIASTGGNNNNTTGNHHHNHLLNLPSHLQQQPIDTSNMQRIRRWKIFPGRNRFFCDGRIIMAKQISVFYFTLLLINATCILFFYYDCPYLAQKVSWAIPVVAAVLYIFVMGTLLRTSFTDPGIIPRATPDEAADVELTGGNSPNCRPPPRTKEVIINNQSIKLKYCFTCKIFRPPRASHCSLCDNCVERFDHHCPWVGNCVGKRNYRFFYMFIVSLAFLCVYVFACIITHLILLSKDSSLTEAIQMSPGSMGEAVVCFFSVWSILGLAGFHTYLIFSNLTTNEDIKGSYSSKRANSVTNPYSKGSVWANCWSILCSTQTPSLIKSRSYIYCDEQTITMAANRRTNGSISGASGGSGAGGGGHPLPRIPHPRTSFNAAGYPMQPQYPNIIGGTSIGSPSLRQHHQQQPHQQYPQQQQQQQQQPHRGSFSAPHSMDGSAPPPPPQSAQHHHQCHSQHHHHQYHLQHHHQQQQHILLQKMTQQAANQSAAAAAGSEQDRQELQNYHLLIDQRAAACYSKPISASALFSQHRMADYGYQRNGSMGANCAQCNHAPQTGPDFANSYEPSSRTTASSLSLASTAAAVAAPGAQPPSFRSTMLNHNAVISGSSTESSTTVQQNSFRLFGRRKSSISSNSNSNSTFAESLNPHFVEFDELEREREANTMTPMPRPPVAASLFSIPTPKSGRRRRDSHGMDNITTTTANSVGMVTEASVTSASSSSGASASGTSGIASGNSASSSVSSAAAAAATGGTSATSAFYKGQQSRDYGMFPSKNVTTSFQTTSQHQQLELPATLIAAC